MLSLLIQITSRVCLFPLGGSGTLLVPSDFLRPKKVSNKAATDGYLLSILLPSFPFQTSFLSCFFDLFFAGIIVLAG